MRADRGQALLELALCAPVLLLLGLGTVATVEVIDAYGGLQAATDAAVSAASRAADQGSALALARSTFAAVSAAYPLRSAVLSVSLQGYARGSTVSADSTAVVDLAGRVLTLHAHAQGLIEPYRSRP